MVIYIDKKTAHNKCMVFDKWRLVYPGVPHLLSGLHTHDFTQTPRIQIGMLNSRGILERPPLEVLRIET